MRFPSHFFRAFIVVFCLWHMGATALYAIPASVRDPLSVFVKQSILPVIRPYFLVTSQWQQWNLFSPDPLMRVTKYTFERQTATGWQHIAQLDIPPATRNKNIDIFKILNRLDGDGDKDQPVRAAFVRSYCTAAGVPPNGHLRLHTTYYDIPLTKLTYAQWQQWQPAIQEGAITLVSCAAAL
ncbi:MAG: hypothetical protein JWM56_960 [Candidatus Peribacteria bacterium]|nr:hypothetical protein [Candidatus Peribacteria bacterium]